MKKRYSFAAAVFAAVLALSVTACSTQTEGGTGSGDPSSKASSTSNTTAAPAPYEVYKQAMEATEARESGKDSMKMEISYDMSGVAVTVKVMQDLTYTGKTMDDEILMDMQMEFMGQNMTNTVYYKDQNAYMSVMGQKVKSPIASQEELNEALSLEESGTDDLDLTEENFKKAALTDNGDGTQTLTAELSDEMAASFSKELLESMEIASDSLKIENFSLVMTIRDKALASIKMDIKINAAVEMPDMNDPTKTTSTQTEMVISAEMTYSKPGETVTINPPADLDSYLFLGGEAA